MSFAYFLRRAATYWGDTAAVMQGDRVLTYGQLDERSNRLANAMLGLGLVPGDRVAVQSRNCVELVEIEMAVTVDDYRQRHIPAYPSTKRGKMPAGAGSAVPAANAPAAPRAVKSRAAASTPNWSSIWPIAVGITGWVRMARWRKASIKV